MRILGEALVSVVVPLCNEQGNVGPLVAALCAVLDAPFELILVDDGSTDSTWEQIGRACVNDPRIRAISLTRNFGHQNALFAGLHEARGRAIITMDGDLQHPPGLVPELVKAWRGGFKVVNTCRMDPPGTSRFKRLTSRWFYALFSRLSGVALSAGSSDFRLLDREVLDRLLQMKDTDLFVRGLVSWLGFPATTIAYEAGRRRSGASKYSLLRMLQLSSGALISFSMLPLKAGIWIGFLVSCLAAGEAVYIVLRFLQGATVPGWASTMTVISFGFGVLFVLMGILGTYVGKVFEILKCRPHYVVNGIIGDSQPERKCNDPDSASLREVSAITPDMASRSATLPSTSVRQVTE